MSSLVPTHQSAAVGASLRSGLVPALRLDVTAPMDETVAALNRFQPRLLVGYASALNPSLQSNAPDGCTSHPRV